MLVKCFIVVLMCWTAASAKPATQRSLQLVPLQFEHNLFLRQQRNASTVEELIQKNLSRQNSTLSNSKAVNSLVLSNNTAAMSGLVLSNDTAAMSGLVIGNEMQLDVIKDSIRKVDPPTLVDAESPEKEQVIEAPKTVKTDVNAPTENSSRTRTIPEKIVQKLQGSADTEKDTPDFQSKMVQSDLSNVKTIRVFPMQAKTPMFRKSDSFDKNRDLGKVEDGQSLEYSMATKMPVNLGAMFAITFVLVILL